MSKFYLIVDTLNNQVLSDYKGAYKGSNDIDWDDSDILNYGKNIHYIHSSARFASIDDANKVVELLSESMKKDGEKFDLAVVYVESVTEIKDIVRVIKPNLLHKTEKKLSLVQKLTRRFKLIKRFSRNTFLSRRLKTR